MSRMEGLRALGRQFGTYFVVGGGVTALHYSLLITLVEMFKVDPVLATSVGYVVGGVASYLLHRRITYASDRPHGEATWRFLTVWSIGLSITACVMTLLVHRLGLPYLLAQVMTTGITLFWNFTAHRFWTFRTPSLG